MQARLRPTLDAGVGEVFKRRLSEVAVHLLDAVRTAGAHPGDRHVSVVRHFESSSLHDGVEQLVEFRAAGPDRRGLITLQPHFMGYRGRDFPMIST